MRTILLSLVFLATTVGCGGEGDDGDVPASDSGTSDAASFADTGVATDSGATVDSGTDTTPGMCPAGACDLAAQTGCANPGEACYFGTTEEGADPMPLCAVEGTAAMGEPCTAPNNCAAGLLCDGSVCRALCCEMDSSLCPDDQECSVSLQDSEGNPSGVGVCRAPDTCDLLAQTGCEGNEGCYPNGPNGAVICISSTQNLGEGEVCTAANSCAPGFACSGAMGSTTSQCHKFCDRTDGEPGCEGGQTCTGVTGFSTDVGVCTPASTGSTDGGT